MHILRMIDLLNHKLSDCSPNWKEKGKLTAQKIKKGHFFAVELEWNDQAKRNSTSSDQVPWVIMHADSAIRHYEGDTKHYTGKEDETWMGTLNHNDHYIMATKLVPLSTGSSIFSRTDKSMWVFPSDIRAIVNLTDYAPPRTSRHQPTHRRFTLTKAQRDKILLELSVA